MLRKTASKFANFIIRRICRHSVLISCSVETEAEIKQWLVENVSKRDVFVDYKAVIITDENNLIQQVIDKHKVEYRFRTIGSAILFKLTFCDFIAH